MRLFTRTFLLPIIAFSCAALVPAQVLPPPPPPPPPATPSRVVGKAKVYEFKAKTTAESVFLDRHGNQIIRATFDVPADRAGKKPEGVQFLYQSLSYQGFKYTDNHQVVITLNNKKTIRNEAKIIMASCHPVRFTECYEILATPLLPFSDFKAMVKAKKVKIQFGETVLELTAEEIEGLRDLKRTLDK